MKKILLVDDETDMVEFLSYNLAKEGFRIYKAYNGLEGLQVAEEVLPDLILLDVMMPEMDGMEMCKKIRANRKLSHVFVVMLSARSETYSQVYGLENGADDYIVKPIKVKILVEKIKAILRRKMIEEPHIIQVKNMGIDTLTYTVSIDDKVYNFPKKEFELLCLLASTPNKIFQRNEIMQQVWGCHVPTGERTVDVHIRKIREKIGEGFIKTVKGVGYCFQ